MINYQENYSILLLKAYEFTYFILSIYKLEMVLSGKHPHIRRIAYSIIILVIFYLLLFLRASIRFFHRHFLVKEVDFPNVYGAKSWIIITGASSGQGKHFALEMAKRGMHLILIGSERTQGTIAEIKKTYPTILAIFIKKDFRRACEPDFFNDIESAIKSPLVNGNISGLINNVAYRTAWNPYHESPPQHINDSIIVGTIVQSQLTRIVIPHFLKRESKSFLVNITAQCIFPTFGLGEILDNNITVPYLSVYEGANAFGFYQGNSIYKEYKDAKYKGKIKILNVMPGAVVTENTEYLGGTMFNVGADKYVSNVVRQIGNYEGNTYGYWGHEFSILLVNLFPFVKNSVLKEVGLNISRDFMTKPKKQY